MDEPTTTTTIEAQEWRVDIDPERLEFTGPDDNPEQRFLTIDDLIINGVWFHIEGIEVHVDHSGIQRAAWDDYDERVQDLHNGVGADGHWQTVELNGRHYLIVASPHC